MEHYCFVSELSIRVWILEAKTRATAKGSSIGPPYFQCKTKIFLVLETDWRLYGWYSELTITLIDLTKYTKFKLAAALKMHRETSVLLRKSGV